MRLMTAFCLVAMSTICNAQGQPTNAQCDALIGAAIRDTDRERGIKVLDSETVRGCFKRFPALEYKHFPLRSDANGVICDRGPHAVAGTGTCPEHRDPAFSVRPR